jgi:hypothetical protein
LGSEHIENFRRTMEIFVEAECIVASLVAGLTSKFGNLKI